MPTKIKYETSFFWLYGITTDESKLPVNLRSCTSCLIAGNTLANGASNELLKSCSTIRALAFAFASSNAAVLKEIETIIIFPSRRTFGAPQDEKVKQITK